MRLGRTALVALLAAFLICAGLPSVSAASGTVTGSGQVHRIDLTAKTLMVGRHNLKLDFRSRLYDLQGRLLTVEELQERFDGDDAKFEAYAIGTQMYLRTLHLADHIEER
jgi:hypothetical protein